MKKLSGSLIFFSLISCYTFAQQIYIVPFEKKSGAIFSKFTTMSIVNIENGIDNLHELKGIPSSISIYSIFYFTINNFYKGGGVIKENNVKDANALTEERVYIYVGLNKERREKYVIIDSNKNLDFGDDKLYTFILDDYNIPFYSSEQYALCPEIKIKMAFDKNSGCSDSVMDLILNPFYSDKSKKQYDSEDEYYLEVGIFTNFYQQGILKINKNLFFINESKNTDSFLPFPHEDLNSASVYCFYQENDTISPNSFSLGDTILLVDRKIYLKAFEENKLYIEDLGSLSDSSKVGCSLPTLFAKELVNKETVFLNELMRNKYVFIDFWGSWCGPCIASISKLKILYNTIRERDDVFMLGISLEYEENVDKLKKIIKDKHIEWVNVWNNGTEVKLLSSVHGKLQIRNFPTYMIIDKEGKIVYKGEMNLEKAINTFINLINE